MSASVASSTAYSVRRLGGHFALIARDPIGKVRMSDIVRLYDRADDALDALLDLRALEVTP